MSDRTDWAAFASVLDGEREAIRAGLPDGVACTLSLTAYGGLPTTYAVLLRHAASGAGTYGSGPTPAAAGVFRAHWSEMEPVAPVAARPATARGLTAVARYAGATGDVCHRCGGANVVRNGSCLLCRDCGETSGCS